MNGKSKCSLELGKPPCTQILSRLMYWNTPEYWHLELLEPKIGCNSCWTGEVASTISRPFHSTREVAGSECRILDRPTLMDAHTSVLQV